MIRALVLSLLFTSSISPTAMCLLDNQIASYTGKQRETSAGTECQYKHIRFRYSKAGILVEEPHEFWQSCTP